jgi:hypothetical protein
VKSLFKNMNQLYIIYWEVILNCLGIRKYYPTR